MGSRRRIAAVLVSATLVASACSSGDGDTAGNASSDGAENFDAAETPDAPDAPATGSGGDDDGGPAPAAAGDVPGGVDEDFPVPFPEGWVVDTQAALAGVVTTGAASVLYTVDDLDRIVDFYDDWISDQADISRADADGSVTYRRADPLLSITIVANFEYEGDTYTALQVSAASE